MTPSRFLVTGGAGFIGSHLCDELLARGHDVHVLDDLSTGSMANIDHLVHDPRFGFTRGTCRDEHVVAELVDRADAVFHLAGAVGVELVVESPVRTIETNVLCTEIVLRHAATTRTPVLLASTSEVYGKSHALPFREDADLLLGPTTSGRWAYACSKALDEFLALARARESGQPVVVARLFNTVGPRQSGRYGMVVPRFVAQALGGESLTVHGDGEQQRCFCHVGDVVRALADLLPNDRAYGEVFNVGSTEEVSIATLAERVRDLTGSTADIVWIPYEDAHDRGFEDVRRRVPDIAKIRDAIGWEPVRTLDDVITDVVASLGLMAQPV